MSIEIPEVHLGLDGQGDYSSRNPINSQDYADTAAGGSIVTASAPNEANHYSFSRSGARFSGVTFTPGFDTTSGTFTQTNEANGRDLDKVNLGSRCIRKLQVTGSTDSVHEIRLQSFGQSYDLGYDVYRLEEQDGVNDPTNPTPKELLTSGTASYSSTTADWNEEIFSLEESGSGGTSETRENGNPSLDESRITIEFQARLNSGEGGSTGTIYQIQAASSRIDGDAIMFKQVYRP